MCSLVSWTRAFKAAILTIAYWIVWAIIGGIIAVGGLFSMSDAISYTNYGLPHVELGRAFGGLILVFIGWLIILLGFYATIYKVLTEIIVDEVRTISPAKPLPPVAKPAMPEVEVYCPSCGCKNPADAKFCIKCGAPLR